MALSANIIGELSPGLKAAAASPDPWPSFKQFKLAYEQALRNPHLRLQEDFRIEEMWERPVYKFQAVLSKANNRLRKEELWKSVPTGRPRSGRGIMVDALSGEQYAVRQQAIANEDPSASAWLTASPAWPENQMNDIAFRTSFQLRNLLPVRTEKWCHCGKEMDSLASHMFVCSNRSTLNQIRNTMHAKLCRAVKRISTNYFKTAQMYPLNGEPHCADFFPRKDNAPIQDVPVDNPGGDPLTERRADFGFSGGARTILVDCTTISPLAKIIKDYKPGKAADYATKRKEKYYQRFLDIKTTDRCAIFFFAVETSGGLGREARNYVKMLAKLSGGPMGFTIMRIYQTLAVEVQTARANQVYFTKNFAVNARPPPPSGP
jgi:hypothetical protein